jgi:hypothetical protein
VYGLLAVCAALVLGTHDWSSGSDDGEFTRLTGRTSDGFRIQMGVQEGKLQSFDTHARVRCPSGETRQWRWYPADGVPVRFHRDGPRFRVFERTDRTAELPPAMFTNAMRGRLSSDGRSARGTIAAYAAWYRDRATIACSGLARFRARAID